MLRMSLLSRLLWCRRLRRERPIDRTRRLLIAGIISSPVASPALAALPSWFRGGHPSGGPFIPPVDPGPDSETLTFVNSSASSSPSDVPILATMWFRRGRVPAGSIAEPSLDGVTALPYQADNLLYWEDDGSLRGAVFRIAHSIGYSAGQSRTYQFLIRSGSYSNTTTITVADIVAATDPRVVLTNLHTAQTIYNTTRNLTVTMSGGQINGVKIWYPTTNANVGARFTGTSVPGSFTITASISGTILTASGTDSGTITSGAILTGPGVAPGTILGAVINTTNKTYRVNISQTVASTSMIGSYSTLTIDSMDAGSPAIVALDPVAFPNAAMVVKSASITTPAIITKLLSSSPATYILTGSHSATSEHMIGAVQIENGGGTGAAISILNGVPTVEYPGSGYSHVGTGTFEVSMADVIAGINADGNHANGKSIEVYAQGPYCLGIRVRTAVVGCPHAHVTFYVEYYRKANGTFLDIRRCAFFGNALMEPSNPIYNLTLDLDFYDGDDLIVGAAGGDTRFQTMAAVVSAQGGALDLEGLPYWRSANDAAWKAIAHERTPEECDYLRSTGVILPYRTDSIALAGLPTKIPTEHRSWYLNGTGERDYIFDYCPFANIGVRSALGAGGNGTGENPMWETDGNHLLALRQGQTTKARVYRRNIRIGALHGMSIGQLGGGIFEPDTMYVPNVVPASAKSFPGMLPTREAIWLGDFTDNGYSHPLIAIGNFQQAFGRTYHQTDSTYGAFLLEGEQWLLDAATHQASGPTIGRFHASEREITVGGTTYYGVQAGATGNTRRWAWAMNSAGKAAALMPKVWANGATNVERSYVAFCVQSQFDYLNALVPHIGTVKIGRSGTVRNKTINFSGSGVYPEMFYSGSADCTIPYMDVYHISCMAQNGFLLKGTPEGDALITYREYMKNQFVKLWAKPGTPHYLLINWRIQTLSAGQVSPPIDWDSAVFSHVTPSVGVYPIDQVDPAGRQVMIKTTSGSNVVTLISTTTNLPGSVMVTKTTRMADGSRIMVTSTPLAGGGSGAVKPIPVGLDQSFWYHWKELTPSTGQLCTDAALTSPVTLGSTHNNVDFWLIPSNIPSDFSGEGTYFGGKGNTGWSYLQQQLAAICLLKAYGSPDDGNGNNTAAINTITNLAAASGGMTYTTGVQYAMDTKLTV